MTGQDDDNFDYAKHAAQLAHDNDKENTMIDRKALDQAREWANDGPIDRRTIAAAAEVIRSLPDEWVDADKVRELSALVRKDVKMGEQYDLGNAFDKGHTSASRWIAGALDNLLPSPPRRPAMIKRGATAWHDELGEVTILSNKPNRGAGLAAVTDLVRVAADWDEGDDGSQVATVNASSLTAPDEGLVDSGAPETNNDSADDEEVDDYRVEPSLGVTHNDWWGASRPMTQADVVRADGAPVEPTRSFPKGAHYDSEGNATEPEDVPAGEAWQVIARYHHAVVPAIKCESGWVFVDRHGDSIVGTDSDVELIAPLVPKPEPRVLTTLEDYQDAPIGIIVRADDPDLHFSAWKKRHGDLWEATAGYKQDNDEMSDVARMVIWAPEEAEK